MGSDPSESGDNHAWRFRLDEKEPAHSALDPTRELLRVQWEELLKMCTPMIGGQAVTVDGFALLRDTQTVIPIYLDDPRWSDTAGGRP